MAKRDDTPRIISTLEKYKVVIDLFGAIAAAVALVALYFSGLGIRSANQSLELARKDHELQAAQLQPVFQVFFKREKQSTDPPVYSDIRVVSPSGTFLDATATLQEFLVVGYTDGELGEGAWYQPERDLAIISTIGFSESSTVVSDKRGTLIQAWDGESEVTEAYFQWTAENGEQAFSRYTASVDFVAIVKISYLDILRQERSLYFKVGGIELSSNTISSLRAAGRAPTLDPKDGQRCFDIYSGVGDETWYSDKTKLRPLYDKFMMGPNKDLGKTCG